MSAFYRRCNPQRHTKDMTKKGEAEGGAGGWNYKERRKSTYDLVNKLRLNYIPFILVA